MVQSYMHSAHLLSHLLQSHPDIVLLDGTHPVYSDGWKAAVHLHDSGCQVVMFTAHHAAIQEVGTTSRAAVFAGAIAKPCNIDDVLLTLTRV